MSGASPKTCTFVFALRQKPKALFNVLEMNPALYTKVFSALGGGPIVFKFPWLCLLPRPRGVGGRQHRRKDHVSVPGKTMLICTSNRSSMYWYSSWNSAIVNPPRFTTNAPSESNPAEAIHLEPARGLPLVPVINSRT